MSAERQRQHELRVIERKRQGQRDKEVLQQQAHVRLVAQATERCMCACMHVYMCACVHVCMCVCDVCIGMYVYIYIYIHMYTRLVAQANERGNYVRVCIMNARVCICMCV